MRYNHELYEGFDEPKIYVLIKLRKMEWAGNVQKMKEGRIPNKVMTRNPDTRRPRGVSRTPWRKSYDEVVEKLLRGGNWTTRTTNPLPCLSC